MRSALETRLHQEGVRVVRGNAEVDTRTIEVVVEYAGAELEFFILGFPLFVPGVPVALGDISLLKTSTQTGRARLGLRFWSPTGEIELLVPAADGTAYFKNFSFLTFFGDFVWTDVDDFVAPGAEKKLDVEPDDVEATVEDSPQP